jgi:hypothetical protein
VGALFGATAGVLVLLVGGLWAAAGIVLIIGAITGGLLGLLVGTLNGAVLAVLAQTAWFATSEATRLRRTRCAAMATSSAASVVGGGVFGSSDVQPSTWLFVSLPGVVAAGGAFILSRRLPPGRPSRL